MSTSPKPQANPPEPRGTVRAGLSGFWRRAKSFLLQVVYPENAVCRGCHHVSDDGCLCSRCRQELRDESASFAWEWRDLDGFRAYSLRPHRGLARSLVIRLKYQAEACLADELTALLEPLPVFLSFPPDTVVTWVPMPERRRRERCVDHARLLAESAARRLGLPAAPLLRRVSPREVPTQAGSNREARRRSLKGAFEALGPVSFPVLLVDDVLTTGTTVSRCAEALRAAGAMEITALTVTRAELGRQ